MPEIKPGDLGLVVRSVGSLDAHDFYRRHGFLVLRREPLRRPKYVLFDEGNRQIHVKAPKVLSIERAVPVSEQEIARDMFGTSTAEREKAAGLLEALRAGGVVDQASILRLSEENAPVTMNCDADIDRLGNLQDGFVSSGVLRKVLS